jgi:hypothetical protein
MTNLIWIWFGLCHSQVSCFFLFLLIQLECNGCENGWCPNCAFFPVMMGPSEEAILNNKKRLGLSLSRPLKWILIPHVSPHILLLYLVIKFLICYTLFARCSRPSPNQIPSWFTVIKSAPNDDGMIDYKWETCTLHSSGGRNEWSGLPPVK